MIFLPYVLGKKVLDIGCGGGFMVEAFGRFARDAVGVDISENSIAYARKHWPQFRFYAEDLTRFAKRSETFDFVFSSEVLEHVLDPHEFMRAVQACVRIGGFVYISAPDVGHKKVPENLKSWGDICPPEHLNWFNIRNLSWLFVQYGFIPHRVHKSTTPAHSVIFKRVAI